MAIIAELRQTVGAERIVADSRDHASFAYCGSVSATASAAQRYSLDSAALRLVGGFGLPAIRICDTPCENPHHHSESR